MGQDVSETSKAQCITLLRGNIDLKVIFTIANNSILMVHDGPVKSLGRWYDSGLKDTYQAQEVTQCLQNGIGPFIPKGCKENLKFGSLSMCWCQRFIYMCRFSLSVGASKVKDFQVSIQCLYSQRGRLYCGTDLSCLLLEL